MKTWLLPIVAALIVAGCSGSSEGAKNVGDENTLPSDLDKQASDNLDAVDKPESILFETGRRNFSAGLYSVAKQSFDALKLNHPLGAYAEYAEVKSADCLFEAGEYAEAAAAYEEFTRNYPGSHNSEYALLRAARSHQLANRGAGRDPTSLKKAVSLYDSFLNTYPASIYIRSARDFREESLQTLAEHEKAIIDFYKKQGHSSASEARSRDFQNQFGESSDTFVTSQVIPSDSTLMESEAKMSRAGVTAVSLPGSPTSPHEIMPAEGREEAGSTPALPSQTEGTLTTVTARAAECSPSGEIISLFLNHPYPASNSIAPASIKTRNGALLIPETALRPPSGKSLVQICPGPDGSHLNITLSPAGELKIKPVYGEEVSLLEMDNPPRLIFGVTAQPLP